MPDKTKSLKPLIPLLLISGYLRGGIRIPRPYMAIRGVPAIRIDSVFLLFVLSARSGCACFHAVAHPTRTHPAHQYSYAKFYYHKKHIRVCQNSCSTHAYAHLSSIFARCPAHALTAPPANGVHVFGEAVSRIESSPCHEYDSPQTPDSPQPITIRDRRSRMVSRTTPGQSCPNWSDRRPPDR